MCKHLNNCMHQKTNAINVNTFSAKTAGYLQNIMVEFGGKNFKCNRGKVSILMIMYKVLRAKAQIIC